ncbi:hypothetical protein [Terasakiella pusilla]|uniref:hypothetical protein n=1 Tax=Terasakiella pusilla TaxID=64973 RepID=UPI003AA9249F
MINAKHLRLNVIRPTLEAVGLWSFSAENLLMGTAAQESRLGEYLVQLGNGPARGIFQMEPATLDDIYKNYLAYRPNVQGKVDAFLSPAMSKPDNLTCNLAYAALMCRVHYMRVPAPLPEAHNVEAMGRYWKRYYNTPAGKGTEAEFIENYHRFVEV